MIDENKYYVYTLLDSTKPGKYFYEDLDMCFLYEPFYIGKGSGNRMKSHFYPSSLSIKSRKSNRIKSIVNKNKEVIKIKMFENITEYDSLSIEEKMILSIGRKDLKNGPLTNLTDGGDGTSNCKIIKTRKKVFKICPDTLNVIDEYESITIASDNNNTHITNISRCCLGVRGAVTSGGYMWSFTKNITRTDNCKKKVDLINDINIIKTYNSFSEASKELNLDPSHISRCCLGELLTVGGYKFQYNDKILKEKYKRSPFKKTTAIKIIQRLSNVTILHSSMKECSNYNKTSQTSISRILKGRSFNKYEVYYRDKERRDKYPKFTYKKRGRSIIQLSNMGEFIKNWESLTEADEYGFKRKGIRRSCKGIDIKYKGYKWVYESEYQYDYDIPYL